MNIGLPKGVKIFSSEETNLLRYIEDNISKTIEKWGYDKIYLPDFEYFEVHKKALGSNLENQTFRFVDRYEGEILTLRADFTAQIARYVASLREKEFPLRVYYNDDVFRYVPPKAENLWQLRQIGIELIGSNKLEADAEIIAVAINSLKSLGIDSFQIDLNTVSIFYAIKDILKLENKEFENLMKLIKNREFFNLKTFLKKFNINEDLKEFIENIPRYQGNIELINLLTVKLQNYSSLLEPLQQLKEIYKILKSYGFESNLSFDLGEAKEFDYYTGVIFEIFLKDFKKPIGVGGRYDSLIGRYNGNIPATGFAFDLFSIYKYLKEKTTNIELSKKDYFIVDLTEDKETAYKISSLLREKEYKVARDIVDRDFRESIKFAFKNGFKYVIVIGIEKNKDELYLYEKEKEYKKIKIEELIK